MTPLNRLLASRTVSYFGDAMIPLTATFGVLHVDGGLGGVSLVMGTQLACTLLMPLGGVLADRKPRALMILGGDAVMCVIQALTGVLLLTGHASVGVLVALTALYGVANAVVSPALTALIGELTPPDGLQKTNARFAISRNGVRLFGPAAAGVIVTVAGAGASYLVDAATFAASVLLLRGVQGAVTDTAARERAAAEPMLASFRTGWREMVRIRWYRDTLLLFAVWNLGYMPVFVIGPVLFDADGDGAREWATVGTAAALGAVLGGVVAHVSVRRRALLVPSALVAAAAAEPVAIAVGAHVLVVAAGALAAGLVITIYDTAWDTAIQALVPQEVMSRIDSYTWLIGMGTMPLGLLVTAPVSELIGAEGTLWAGVALMLGSSAALVALPSIRHLLLPEQVSSREPVPADAG